MTTVNFYHDLPVLESFAEAIEPARHAQVPGDWWVVIADVIGSTKAIEGGGYKKVNTVGVACIAAVVNVDRGVEVPFVFGGDGATFAVPDSLRERVIPALREAQRLSRLTCYNGNHLHFVDGSDGGYAIAARGLKAQLESLKV